MRKSKRNNIIRFKLGVISPSQNDLHSNRGKEVKAAETVYLIQPVFLQKLRCQMDDLEAAEVVAKLQAQAKSTRKKNYRKSRLDDFKGELLIIKKNNGRPVDLQRWLRANRIKVELSTVTRWLAKNGKD